MTIDGYATETAAGEEVHYYGEGVSAYHAAKKDAQTFRYRVIEYHFEYTDSEMIEDYTEEPSDE